MFVVDGGAVVILIIAVLFTWIMLRATSRKALHKQVADLTEYQVRAGELISGLYDRAVAGRDVDPECAVFADEIEKFNRAKGELT